LSYIFSLNLYVFLDKITINYIYIYIYIYIMYIWVAQEFGRPKANLKNEVFYLKFLFQTFYVKLFTKLS